MLIEIFVLPSSGRLISNAGLNRLIKSVHPEVCASYVKCIDFEDINREKKEKPFYGVFYDNEYLSKNLSVAIKHFLLYSRGIDMFTMFFFVQGSNNVQFQPRVFVSSSKLDLDKKQPIPINADNLEFEKILDGWVYRD